jgi:hypothetical protein
VIRDESPDTNPIEKAFSKLKAYRQTVNESSRIWRGAPGCAGLFKSTECTNSFAAAVSESLI